MTFFITGQNQEWQRSRSSLLLALSLSIFLVYVIMAAQFESLLQPLIIMLTIPLAFFGTIVALKVLGISLSVVVFLGMIMLAGIVVNNAIVLVDYINRLKRRGLDRDEAVVTAGSVRSAADPDDHRHHRARAAADGPRARRRRRDPHAHGDCGDLRAHRLHRPDAAHHPQSLLGGRRAA